MRDALGAVELPDLYDRMVTVQEVASEAVDRAESADRAAALGLDGLVPQRRDAAERARRIAENNFQSLRAYVADRLDSQEWQALVQRLEGNPPPARALADQLDDVRLEIRDRILDSDLSAGDAAEQFDQCSRLVERGKQGIAVAFRQVVESLDSATEVLQRDTFGREPASPSTADYVACTAVATAVLIAALAVCFHIPFCWCCYSPIAVAVYVAAINRCNKIPH